MKNTSDMISLYAKNLEMLQKMFPTSVSDEDVLNRAEEFLKFFTVK
jgi:hypothetical protein